MTDIFESILVNEIYIILVNISLNSDTKALTDNKHSLVQVVTWQWTFDKPWTELMMNNASAGTSIWHH